MNKIAKNTLVPKLRFQEFSKNKEWQLTTIGEIGKFHYGKSAPKWSLSNDALTLCVRYGELYTKYDTIISEIFSRTNIDPSNLKFSKGGEILVPRVGEVPQDFAKHCCYLPYPNIAIGEMISVYETTEYPIFYTYYFRSLWKQFAQVVEGQNVKNLYYINLEPIVIGKPAYFEQKKIADCLSSLDEYMTAQSKKLEALKVHKKGLMQNLFPAEGETVPKLRFKEFEDDGEWLYKNGDKLFETISNKNHNSDLPILAITQEHGAIPRNKIDYNVIVTDKSIESYKVIEIGDFIISLRSFQGGIEYSNYKGICSPAYIILRKKKKVDIDLFYKYYFKSDLFIQDLNKNIEGIRDGKMVSYKQFSEILLPSPKTDEQQKIANCLSSLDDLIAVQSQKIEALKTHKKGLMQGLFPVINEKII